VALSDHLRDVEPLLDEAEPAHGVGNALQPEAVHAEGKLGTAMMAAVCGGMPRNASAARSTARRSESATAWPFSSARTNAAFVLGYFCSQAG
jgi:hypothetical protein